MKYMTVKDIRALKEHIYAKTAEINSFDLRLKQIHNLIPVMSEKAKAEARIEALNLKAKIAERRAYITKAKAKIAEFYSPAIKVA